MSDAPVGAPAPAPAPALAPSLRIRGQAVASSAGLDLVRSGRAQSILLVGPSGVGKTTLALDLAAALLCTAEVAPRPCRACRACRLVDNGNHPDVHRLAPEGPGGQIRIGSRTDPEPGTIRRLIAELSLLPVEGGWRVAILEHADRMNEDAQSALLKTLEEPPRDVAIVLCADEEERLLPTVRSRCARLRLGPLGPRAIEELLGELNAADAPTAARLGRLAGGRPGVALAWAGAPDAVVARGEIARTLLDLLAAPRADRLVSIRALLATAAVTATTLAQAQPGGAPEAPRSTRGRRGAGQAPAPEAAAEAPEPEGGADALADGGPGGRRAAASERRRAAVLLIEIWRALARDLALAQLGETRTIRDLLLLDDLAASAARLPDGTAGRFLARLDRAGELLESNVSPELVADGLVLAWPRPAAGT